ncbi:MAG: Glycosyl transferase group 1 [Rhodobacteraceae bacterium]|uniref:glycosyltransferase family 4 protein n=1 Tax=Cypionkella sp. TaxID=2811411 RepID=UPI0013297F3C|nr:glycosyltransferase family 1 protein [Cypionkella sp.]KAF0175806.1 MAG: Glycosyl transferase group 1 [Paracoccaceae bacterium]MDO8326468.1 glycosyltransferase family 1 protein [Cypionkella sp.]
MVPARLLDLTRLLSRLGRGPMTGVDRVEFAYLDHLLALPDPVYGLIRSAIGYLLLDRVGMAALRDGRVDLTRSDWIGRLAYRDDPARARAEAGIRRLAIARIARTRLAQSLRRYLPAGASYLNTGHANLDGRTLRQIHAAGLRIAVLVHDTIPLDHPEFARADMIAPFRRKMETVAQQADLVIHTSHDARAKTEAQFASMGRVPEAVVANLGVTVAALTDLPFAPQPPYFVILGTIEPRKNHALLLDIWEKLPNPPRLYIVGGRGWSNEAIAARLDALPPGSAVRELTGLADGAVASLLQGAQALLFPSHAEGFGLPALEAAALGTPVIAADLPVFRELLGDFAVYLNAADSYSWLETISELATTELMGAELAGRIRKTPPNWADHFKIVLRRV